MSVSSTGDAALQCLIKDKMAAARRIDLLQMSTATADVFWRHTKAILPILPTGGVHDLLAIARLRASDPYLISPLGRFFVRPSANCRCVFCHITLLNPRVTPSRICTSTIRKRLSAIDPLSDFTASDRFCESVTMHIGRDSADISMFFNVSAGPKASWRICPNHSAVSYVSLML